LESGEEPGEEGLLIYPGNWLSVQVFVALSHCWRIDSMNGIYQGLDRPSIVATLSLMRVKRKQHPGIFNDLQLMEGEAMAILNKRD
jgi:Phage related hypothetical protein (DUF1799)